MIDFSIIVPVYKTPIDLLDKCLDSLVNQNYDSKSYEIIVINDGSNDDKIDELCNKYRSYSQFIYYNNSNKGVSYTRNFGLKLSKGQFIIFVDSDDYIHKDYLQISKKLASIDKIISFDVCKFSSKSLANLPSGNGVVWGKVFPRNIIFTHNIEFDNELKFFEDNLFISTSLSYAPIQEVHQVLYFYRVNENSVLHRYDINNYKSIQKGLVKLFPLYKSKSKFFESTFHFLLSIILPTGCLHKDCTLNRKEIKKYYRELFSDKYFYASAVDFALKSKFLKFRICAVLMKLKLYRIAYILYSIRG